MGSSRDGKGLQAWTSLLRAFMVNITSSSGDGLQLSASILVASSKSLPIRDRIIPRTSDQVKIAIDVVKGCPRSDLVEDMYTILTSMPDLSAYAKKDRKGKSSARISSSAACNFFFLFKFFTFFSPLSLFYFFFSSFFFSPPFSPRSCNPESNARRHGKKY